uniref:5'-nucleotidase SurE n=1 Tax=Schlesneria paludicola TaxID=360056 RepID=A0A7C4LQ33_9PLAN
MQSSSRPCILLANDDGIHSPGLHAMADALREWGDVTVVAPAVEQSGVGHSITYLHPLLAHREHRHDEFFGWRVEGSPADCVRLGILEFCPRRPDVVVSGINAGCNVGINVLYSGTVAAAIEGAFFGVPAVAVSQWLDTPPDYEVTARRAVALIQQLLPLSPAGGTLWNINFPAHQSDWPRGVRVTAMGVRRNTETMERRIDPRGRTYYWTGWEPIRSQHFDPGTDLEALQQGYVTITPLRFDLTDAVSLTALHAVDWMLPNLTKSHDFPKPEDKEARG